MINIDLNEASVRGPGEIFGTITLRPNNSLTWSAAKFFLGTLFAISLAIAISFTWQGYWVILFFTVIEMSVVGICFYYILQRSNLQEVVRFSALEVVLERGARRPETRYVWQRFFTKVLVHKPQRAGDTTRVSLRHRSEEHEIGAFLNAADKTALIEALQRMVNLADRAYC